MLEDLNIFEFFGGGADSLGGAADFLGGSSFESASFHGFGKGGIIEGLFSGESAALRNLFSHLGRVTCENIIELAELNITEEFIKKCFGHSQGVSKAELGAASKAIKAHSLINEQLQKHAPGSVTAMEYAALGTGLPSEKLLERAKGTLLRKLHPDLHNGNDIAIKAVNEALNVLENLDKTKAYREILRKTEIDPSLKTNLNNFFKEFSGKQTNFYEEVDKASRLRIGYAAKAREDMGKAERIWHDASSSFKNASHIKQGAIIFATVTGTTLLAYGIAKHIDRKKQAQSHVEALAKEKPQTSLSV